MRISKIAADSDQNERKLNKLEREIDSLRREFNKDSKSFTSDIKEMKKGIREINSTLKDLNIGKRLFFQHKTVFNTLQRKIEKFEAVEVEWKKYKETMDDKIKKMVSRQNRARVKI